MGRPLMTRRWPRPRCSWGLAATFGPRRFALSQRRSSARSSPRCHSALSKGSWRFQSAACGKRLSGGRTRSDRCRSLRADSAYSKAGFELKRLDQRQPAGLIDDQLRARIRACRRSRRRSAKTSCTEPTALCVDMCHERHSNASPDDESPQATWAKHAPEGAES
jgi:hypothetical protein